MQADLAGRARTARDKNNVGDQVLNYMQQAEIRRYLIELRALAKAEHEKSLERRKGLMLSDQERRLDDPIEKLFLEAVVSYDGDKELLIRSIE
ncbi:hypothetical protein JZU69_01715, partial [bacterium]|nr:hypothetical protein [bacterium]